MPIGTEILVWLVQNLNKLTKLFHFEIDEVACIIRQESQLKLSKSESRPDIILFCSSYSAIILGVFMCRKQYPLKVVSAICNP